jgi:hypothetical protein
MASAAFADSVTIGTSSLSVTIGTSSLSGSIGGDTFKASPKET